MYDDSFIFFDFLIIMKCLKLMVIDSRVCFRIFGFLLVEVFIGLEKLI